jgi:hypothetical protein
MGTDLGSALAKDAHALLTLRLQCAFDVIDVVRELADEEREEVFRYRKVATPIPTS